jgi:hypothetical protein
MTKWNVSNADLTDQEISELVMNWKKEYIENVKHSPSVLYQVFYYIYILYQYSSSLFCFVLSDFRRPP